ncbi:MAG: uroporphyrinogen-III synthase, partial [Bacteroidota bacterium]
IAHYLQKFIVYRKRKVFYGKRLIEDMKDSLLKYKKEKFLLPCSNLRKKRLTEYVRGLGIELQEAEMYRTVASDLSDLADITYDMLVFFSPLGIESLYKNFPDFKQNNTRIAAFGPTTCKAVLDRNLEINVKAPLPEAPSMTMAIDRYLKKANS